MKEKIKKTFSNIRWQDMIYPLISLFFLIVLAVIFFMTVKFLYTHIDSALSLDTGEEPSLLRVDIGNLTVVANKLAVPIRTPSETPFEQSAPSTTETEETPVENTGSASAPAATTPDRASVRIAVYNSTATAGVAGKLKSALLLEQFTVAEVGNKTPALETTLIQTKASLDASLRSSINTIVSNSYTISTETLPADSTFDVIITIGAK